MTEQEMISSCKKGDRSAFDFLMEKYQKQVFNIAYGMLSDYEDASDATQEVFFRVFKSISLFKGESSFTTWIYRICSNVCNDILRKRQKRGFSVSIDSDEENDSIVQIVSDEPTPEERVEINERQRAVWAAINELPSKYKEIIVYSDMQQLSYDEIAEILKCPKGTVRSRLNRARNALRKKLLPKRELF